MEFIYMAAGILVVFLCVFMYRQGVKDGRAQKENKPLPPFIQKETKLTEEEIKEQSEIFDKYQAIMNYDPYEVENGR